MLADRRSTISIYILCRVLIEVIGQTTLACVTEDMAEKLEDIIFNQLRSADPDTLISSPLRMANWTLFGQLLGVMSGIDFERVTDRFFADLERMGGVSNKETEAKIELVVRGMSYIKLKVRYPSSILTSLIPNCLFWAYTYLLSYGSFSQNLRFRSRQISCYLWPVFSTNLTDFG